MTARCRFAPLLVAALLPALAGAASPPVSVRARAIRWSDEARNVEVDITYPALAAGTRGAAEFDAFFERLGIEPRYKYFRDHFRVEP